VCKHCRHGIIKYIEAVKGMREEGLRFIQRKDYEGI